LGSSISNVKTTSLKTSFKLYWSSAIFTAGPWDSPVNLTFVSSYWYVSSIIDESISVSWILAASADALAVASADALAVVIAFPFGIGILSSPIDLGFSLSLLLLSLSLFISSSSVTIISFVKNFVSFVLHR